MKEKECRFQNFVGQSPEMQKVFDFIEKAAQVQMPVLLVGETGTGKELAAVEIHRRGRYANGPYVPVNMGALPKELVASELFGHVKGAFTGAYDDRQGRFHEAHLGTLFLDEISTMPLSTQISLLRVLENGRYRPVGAARDYDTDIRLVTATNVDPRVGVKNGLFREDLVHRLEVLRIDLPALRERKEDIPLLTKHFLDIFSKEFELDVGEISQEALGSLQTYDWPGNVRELKNVIAQAVVMAEEGAIAPEHLPQRITGIKPEEDFGFLPIPDEFVHTMASSGTDTEFSIDSEGVMVPLGMPLAEVEKTYLLKTLEDSGNNKSSSSKTLGISRKTLYDKLSKWGIEA